MACPRAAQCRCVFPELNTEFDVYRIGTMLELVREVVTALTADGKRVKVCVQQALGKGVFMVSAAAGSTARVRACINPWLLVGWRTAPGALAQALCPPGWFVLCAGLAAEPQWSDAHHGQNGLGRARRWCQLSQLTSRVN